jgi:predicted O-linked N-acetylglucosamine transferase (SPINDLY family)
VTFGSFNNLQKINDEVLSAWVRILGQVPDALMAIKCPSFIDATVCEDVYRRFEQEGIDRGRVRLCGPTSYFDHLSLLEQVDLLLDCFPFNGCRTTVEGLWMGVPTVTLSGPTFAANMGKDILLRLGLEAFVADSPEQYVSKAVAFASQVDALARIRRSLRPLMLSSSLCDPARFTREMEQALRQIWWSCCSQQKAETPSQRT